MARAKEQIKSWAMEHGGIRDGKGKVFKAWPTAGRRTGPSLEELEKLLAAQAQLAGALDEIGQTPERVEAERYQRLERDRRLAWGRLAHRDEVLP